MATTRRAYTGGATSTTTTSAIAASGTTSFTITAYTGWPYGSDPFFIVVEPGTASEEKILVTRTGATDTTINIASDSERAQDGTSAVAHSSGSIVFPVFTALDADEANELTSSWSTKGDLVSYGSSTFETLGVGSDGQVLVADSGETSGLAWETYTNTLGSGSGNTYPWSSGEELHAADLNDAIKIVQVVSTTKTDTFSASITGGSDTAITGLSVTITPTSASSTILIFGMVSGSGYNASNNGVNVTTYRNGSTEIGIPSGFGNRTEATAVSHNSDKGTQMANVGILVTDSPATTSATTYAFHLTTSNAGAAQTYYVNRSIADTDNVDNNRTISTITVMEVSA